jgi:hypothetical protein
MTEPLSPAALTVWDRFCGIVEDHGPPRLGLAAALRAAADQLTPYNISEMEGAALARNKLLAIATELEGQ